MARFGIVNCPPGSVNFYISPFIPFYSFLAVHRINQCRGSNGALMWAEDLFDKPSVFVWHVCSTHFAKNLCLLACLARLEPRICAADELAIVHANKASAAKQPTSNGGSLRHLLRVGRRAKAGPNFTMAELKKVRASTATYGLIRRVLCWHAPRNAIGKKNTAAS